MRGPSHWPRVAAALAMCLLLAFVFTPSATSAPDTGPPVLLELVSHPAADMLPATIAPFIGVEVEAFAPNTYALIFHVPARYESASSGVARYGDLLLLDYDRAWTITRPYPLLC